MQQFPDYDQYDAVGLAELVEQKDVHPAELVEAAAQRMEAVNGAINAVTRSTVDEARDQAADSDTSGPFSGVPILIKDLHADKDEPVSFGSVLFRDYTGEIPSVLGARIRKAGFISLGRPNTSEFGLLPLTEPTLHGPTRNPWSLAHSPGGSSGGAAAAVAAGIVPFAHGSDGGGSIRIPASNCGLFGLKPTRGRMPLSDYLGIDLGVGRTVRDSAAFLDAVHGPVPGDPYWTAEPDHPFAADAAVDPEPLRIAFSVVDFDGEPVDPRVKKAILDTVTLLESLGHTMIEAAPTIDRDKMAHAFVDVWAAGVGEVMRLVLDKASERSSVRRMRSVLGDYRTMQAIGKLDSRDSGLPAFEPFTWGLARHSFKRTPGDLQTSKRILGDISYRTAAFLEDHDLFLTPVLGSPPVPIGQIDQNAPWDDLLATLFSYVAFTPLANFSGLPAMSVPLAWTEDDLPIGSHFLGRFGDESTLLKLAGQLERAQPWADRRPGALGV